MLTRRELATAPLLWAAAPTAARWTPAWDADMLRRAVDAGHANFDPSEQMLRAHRGPEYQYHTNLRNTVVHPTRNSLEYALLLFAAGGSDNLQRARAVLERVLTLQDTDPASKWYGIWGWYLEEPPQKMSPADWNWADFNGAMLLLIEHKYGNALGEVLRARVLESIRHAAYSVQRRNVAMTYTNIAVKGTFVTLAAASRLNDRELSLYAHQRLLRLCRTLDETGSFSEYNSPTYARVSIVNLTRMRMLLTEDAVLKRAARIEHRFWLHLAKHWDSARGQLAGPHARAYSTDIGKPAWIEKALQGRLGLVDRPDLPPDGEAAIHDLRCPEDIAARFLTVPQPHMHRETFVAAAASAVRPVQGSTWFDPHFSLGSVNRGDFWVQRRPVLAYWGPRHWIAMRFLKDDYDFSSALLYTVQDQGRILGVINFRSPGGDKHISLDPIVNGEFTARRLFARFEIAGASPSVVTTPAPLRVSANLGKVQFWASFRQLTMGELRPRLTINSEGDRVVIDCDLLPAAGAPQAMRWTDFKQASLTFTLALESGAANPKEVDRRLAQAEYRETHDNGIVRLSWMNMDLLASDRIALIAEQDRAFVERLNTKPVPLLRLSDELLAIA